MLFSQKIYYCFRHKHFFLAKVFFLKKKNAYLIFVKRYLKIIVTYLAQAHTKSNQWQQTKKLQLWKMEYSVKRTSMFSHYIECSLWFSVDDYFEDAKELKEGVEYEDILERKKEHIEDKREDQVPLNGFFPRGVRLWLEVHP